MTATFIPPAPNCGHRGVVSFTHVAVIELWLCALCMASIGPLYTSCARCGAFPAPGTQLADTTKGRLCDSCLRNFRAGHRGAP